jgi:CO/xanthine dehydrogenase Mo-binding subunit
MEIADAVTADGWLLGRKMITLHDAGAYTRFSSYGVTKHSFHHTGAYTIPNLRFDGYVVYTNRSPTSAMRGFGVTSVSYAAEIQMNRIAEVLGLDPLELRLKNANRIGDLSANRVRLSDPSTVPVVLAAAERIDYDLSPEYRQMTNEPRSGELLPEHLLASVALNGPASDGRGPDG